MGSNLVFEVIWNPEPIPVEEKIASKQSLIFEMPLGALVSGNGGGAVESVNGKTGAVVLNHLDVDADVFGSAAAVAAQLQIVEDDLNQQLDSLLIDLDNLTQEVGTKANAAAVTQALNTKADLIDGKVPASQLPEHVSDITEYPNSSFFPAVGESGRLYVDITTNISYRWSGTIYVPTGDGGVVLGTTAETAHRGDHGVIAYNHAVSQGNPHNTTTSEINEGAKLFFTEPRVRNTVLTGLDTSTATPVLATDQLLAAIGKLQSQINEMGSDIWNWVHYSEAGILGSYFAEYFINGVGGLYFCIKDNVLYVKGLITVKTSVSSIQNIFVFQNADYYILKPDTLNVNIQYFEAQRINLGQTGSLAYEYVKSGVNYTLKTTSSITAGHVFQILPTALCYVN